MCVSVYESKLTANSFFAVSYNSNHASTELNEPQKEIAKKNERKTHTHSELNEK